MKKLLKVLLIFLFFITSFSVYAWGDETDPIDGSASGGYDGDGGVACGSNCSYSYDPSSKGVRLSLYKYTGGGVQNLRAVGKTVDMNSIAQAWGMHLRITEKKGRLSYTMIEKTKPVFKPSGKAFYVQGFSGIKSLYKDPMGGIDVDEPTFRESVIKYFKLRGTVKEIADMVNPFFGIKGTADEINPAIEILPYYIVIEPTIRHTVAGVSYYGTIYELNQELYNKPNGAVSLWMKNYYGNILVSQLNQEDNDIYDLVAPKTDKASVDYFIDSVTSSSPSSGLSINTNPRSAYGISVYFLSAFRATCATACGAKMGDDKLNCAEQWCESSTGKIDAQNKAFCMSECGVPEDPYIPTCPDKLAVKAAPLEVCKGTAKNVVPNCSVQQVSLASGAKYYYLEKCTLESDITFPEITGLIKPGEGFEYPTLVAGNRTCTIEFSGDYWKYLYASLKAKDKAIANDAIKDFQAREFKNQIYNSSKLDMTMIVDYDVSGKRVQKQVKLIPETVIKDQDVYLSKINLPAKNIYSFAGGKRINSTVRDARTESNNQTLYVLSPVCVSRVLNGNVYDARSGKCEPDDFGPYNKFYTDFRTKIGSEIKTSIKVTDNNPNGLPSENICGDPNVKVPNVNDLSCSLVETGLVKGPIPRGANDKFYYTGDTVKYKLQIEGDRTKLVAAGVNGGTRISPDNTMPLEFSVPVNFTKNETGYASQRIEGWVRKNDGTVILCPTQIVTKETPTCPACVCQLTKTTVNGVTTYSFLRQAENPAGSVYYIRAGGPFDVNNPASKQYIRNTLQIKDGDLPQSVYASVVINGRIINKDCEYLVTPKTCSAALNECTAKNTMTCVVAFCSNDAYRSSDPNKYVNRDDCISRCSGVPKTCKQQYSPTETVLIRQYCANNYANDGYVSADICISDCSSYGSDYFYRSVNPGDPFPNRSAIGNWNGLEERITRDKGDATSLLTGKPEYVINLNETAINQIRTDNKRLNNLGESSYTDYYIASKTARGGAVSPMEYKSRFINNKSNAHGFSELFTVINGGNR